MIEAEIEKYFQYHNSNMRLLKLGFDDIKSQIKDNYKKKNNLGIHLYLLNNNDSQKLKALEVEKYLCRILSGIQVSWSEEALKRILYENNLLTNSQRIHILEQSSIEKRWHTALKIIFSIAYKLVPTNDEICDTVSVKNERRKISRDVIKKYIELKSLIVKYLSPSFLIRNKVQHGEWEFAFKPPYSAEFSPDITTKVNEDNILIINSRFVLVNSFYQLLVDLGRFNSNDFAINPSTTPFEYFYKERMRKIGFEINKINNPDLNQYISDIVQKEIRGDNHRRENSKQTICKLS